MLVDMVLRLPKVGPVVTCGEKKIKAKGWDSKVDVGRVNQ